MTRTTLSSKLNNKHDFSQSEMTKAQGLLGISKEELHEYFFKERCGILLVKEGVYYVSIKS